MEFRGGSDEVDRRRSFTVGEGCDLAPDLVVELDDEASIVLGDRVSIRRGTTIEAHRGSRVVIGNDVSIGEDVFISAMVGIRISDAVDISDMVDIHDHQPLGDSPPNLPAREPAPWASGFAGAPVIVETSATLFDEARLMPGVRIGQNSIVGAHSVACCTIPPNTVAEGAPAKAIRSIGRPLSTVDDRQTLRFACFGTSATEHPGHSRTPAAAFYNHCYFERLRLALQADWPHLGFTFANYGAGDATSLDILHVIDDVVHRYVYRTDVAFYGCGINDVRRSVRGQAAGAVDATEYGQNYRSALALLTATSRRVVCISEPPIGWDDEAHVGFVNAELRRYNTLAADAASEAGADFIDVWPAFTTAAARLAAWSERTRPSDTLWSDGIHLSELGDALVYNLVHSHLRKTDTVADLTTYEILDPQQAQKAYAELVGSSAP